MLWRHTVVTSRLLHCISKVGCVSVLLVVLVFKVHFTAMVLSGNADDAGLPVGLF